MGEIVQTDGTYIDLAQELRFFRFGKPVHYSLGEVASIAESYLEECGERAEMPTVEGFVIRLKVSPSSWSKVRADSVALAEICDFILLYQRESLMQSGLKAKNPRFHEFLMKAVHKVYDIPEEMRTGNNINIQLTDPRIQEQLEVIEKKLGQTKSRSAGAVDVTVFELDE